MDAKKKKPIINSPMSNSTRQGIAPCRGMADVFSVVVFFLIFVAAMHVMRLETKITYEAIA